MNEKKENIKVLTADDVIELSNYTKRQEFLSSYKSWGVWLDIPELNVQVFKALLPKNRAIFVTQYKNYQRYCGEYASPIYRFGTSYSEYHAYEDSCSFIADQLKNLKKLLLEERKEESNHNDRKDY